MTLDIAKELVRRGNRVLIACPADAQNKASDTFTTIDGLDYLFVASGYSVGKVNFLKKVKDFLSLDAAFGKAVSKALAGEKIDLILYSTPPITLANTIAKIKKQQQAKTCLMLKDIFPQNAVDMGMMKKTGIMGLVWRYFRNKEKKLYNHSDYIGCMSNANIRYVLEHNPQIQERRVGLCVNSHRLIPVQPVDEAAVRQKYGLPLDKTIFLYGGNLGKPQGLDYFIRVMQENLNKPDRFFLICGGGNDQKSIEDFIDREKPENVKFMTSIPPDEFDVLSRVCDVGLVFLDHRFTIPNFPSRMLSIMLSEKPILAATDANTDVGEVIAEGDMGWWCESTDTAPFNAFLNEICANPQLAAEKGKNARSYYEQHYTTAIACDQILEGVACIKGN